MCVCYAGWPGGKKGGGRCELMGFRGNGIIEKVKGRRTRGSEIDILGQYGGARAGLLLGWLGVCRLPCFLLGFPRFFGLKVSRRHTPGPRCT